MSSEVPKAGHLCIFCAAYINFVKIPLDRPGEIAWTTLLLCFPFHQWKIFGGRRICGDRVGVKIGLGFGLGVGLGPMLGLILRSFRLTSFLNRYHPNPDPSLTLKKYKLIPKKITKTPKNQKKIRLGHETVRSG